jgi:cobalamin biosynthesis protein CobD/CbiB
LTSLSTLAKTIDLAVLLYVCGVQGQSVTTVVAAVVTAVVLTAVLAIVATILAVVLTVVATVLAFVLTVVLAELSLGNAGCKQHGQDGSEAHDDGNLGELKLRIEWTRK